MRWRSRRELCLGAGAWLLLVATAFGAEVPDRIQGNWLGEWVLESGNGGKQTAQIVALGDGKYQAIFTAYDGSEQQSETFRFLISGSLVDGKGIFAAQINLGEKLG